MIVYQGTVEEFSRVVETNQIIPALEQAYAKKLQRKIPPAEVSAYQNSLPYMERVVRRSGIAQDCGILIDYIVPPSNRRIDFLIAGQDAQGQKNFIIVELKQWQSAEVSDSHDLVRTFLGGANRYTEHPSSQAGSYLSTIVDYNANVGEGKLHAFACACLHNYPQQEPEPLLHRQYQPLVAQAPIFFRDDQEKLETFLARFVKHGKGSEILYELDAGKIRPSKKLMDHVTEMYEGNEEFVLLDEQKVAYERALSIAQHATEKSVIIVTGGPGTGKSVISMTLLGQLLKAQLNVCFVAPNSSFRDAMMKYLAKNTPRTRLKNLFKGSSAFVDTSRNTYDALIIDEAHRLKAKGAYMYKGTNQVEDVIEAAQVSIFFVDDDQAIRAEDIGSVAEIRRVAKSHNATIEEIELVAQFRCAGAEGYMNWVSDVLQLKDTANFDGWDKQAFDFRVVENPQMLKQLIDEKHADGFKARILAGYAWKWTGEKEGNHNAEVLDVTIPEFNFAMPWNSRRVGSTWAVDESGLGQVGCIHTTQGLEFDYVGILIGKDLGFDPETLEYIVNYNEHKDVSGKKGLKDHPERLSRFIRGIYKILMSRGMRGCYVYCADPALQNYLRARLN